MSSLPRLEYHLINAFTTDSPHSGNQAAVVLFPSQSDPRANDDKFLLTTAQDFAFAETAYLVPIDEKNGRWGLRWFTVTVEVPICGHATLAAAKVVLSRYPDLAEIKFETRFWGELTAKRSLGGSKDATSLDITISLSTLPTETLVKMGPDAARLLSENREELVNVLGVKPEDIVSVGEYDFTGKSLIIELSPDVDLKSLVIDPKSLVPCSPGLTIVTQMLPDASSPGRLRTGSRVFFCGVFEDPVTGAAHAFLTGYYFLTPASERIPRAVLDGRKPSEIALDGRQLSTRGGKLFCELTEGGLVNLTGTASEWGQGSLTAW